MVISSGHGKTTGTYKSGGKGGDIFLSEGTGEGVDDYGDGGTIAITGGSAIHSNGGHVVLQSGSSERYIGNNGKNWLMAKKMAKFRLK